MGEPSLLKTARGTYRLSVAEDAVPGGDPWTLTLAAEHQGGLEKFAFRCRIAQTLLRRTSVADAAAACARLTGWLEGQFEQVREAALKSIRSERRLADFEFDETRPGPF